MRVGVYIYLFAVLIPYVNNPQPLNIVLELAAYRVDEEIEIVYYFSSFIVHPQPILFPF